MVWHTALCKNSVPPARNRVGRPLHRDTYTYLRRPRANPSGLRELRRLALKAQSEAESDQPPPGSRQDRPGRGGTADTDMPPVESTTGTSVGPNRIDRAKFTLEC